MSELFGRTREIATIEQFITTTPGSGSRHGTPSALIISGDAGMGKTTLWRMATDLARSAGFHVLTSRCAEAESELSFTALGDLMEAVPAHVHAALSPPLQRALDVALLRSDPGSRPTDWRAIGVAVLEVIRALCADAPVLAAVDDVQWLDGASARVLVFALRRLAGEPVGFLGTQRVGALASGAEPVPQYSGDQRVIADRLATETLAIGPLDPEDIERAVHARLPSRLPMARLAEVIRQSAGNPFFAIELAIAAAEVGGAHEISALPVPAAIAALLGGHLRVLPTDSRELVAVVAMTSGLTRRPADRFFGSPRRAIAALDAAVANGMLSVEAGRIRLAHPLLGTAASASLTAARRREIHRQLAVVIDDDEERAAHLGLATTEPDDEVAAILEKAATQARLRGALETAAALSERSAALTPASDHEGHQRRLVLAGEYRWQIGDMSSASRILEDTLPAISAGPLRARALLCLGRIRFHSRVTWAAEATTQALEECGENLPLRAQALIDHSFVLSNSADGASARSFAEEAVRLSEELGNDDLSAQALAALALLQAVCGEPAAGATLARALELERAVPYLAPARSPSFVAGQTAVWKGDLARARQQIDLAYRRALDWGEESSVPDILVTLAELECLAGDWDASAAYAARASQLAAAVTHERVQASAVAGGAMIAALRGDDQTCREAVESGLALSARTEAMAGLVACESAIALLCLSLGDYAGTDRHLGGLCASFVLNSYDPAVIPFVTDEIEALIGLGRIAEAGSILDQYESRARMLGSGPSLSAALRCRGLLEAAIGDIQSAILHIEAALDLAERLGMPFVLARTRLAHGSVLRRARRWREARHALLQAAEGFESLGAALWLARTRQQRERLGGRQPGHSDLTDAEVQVARLAAAGSTNREISAELFVSIRAVEKTLTTVYRKLGIRSRTELAATLTISPGLITGQRSRRKPEPPP